MLCGINCIQSHAQSFSVLLLPTFRCSMWKVPSSWDGFCVGHFRPNGSLSRYTLPTNLSPSLYLAFPMPHQSFCVYPFNLQSSVAAPRHLRCALCKSSFIFRGSVLLCISLTNLFFLRAFFLSSSLLPLFLLLACQCSFFFFYYTFIFFSLEAAGVLVHVVVILVAVVDVMVGRWK